MATLIKITGTKTTVFPKNKRKGFTLEEVYELLECELVQQVSVNNGAEDIMLVDEEGTCKEGWTERINMEATRIFIRTYGSGVNVIVGNVLLCNDKEWK